MVNRKTDLQNKADDKPDERIDKHPDNEGTLGEELIEQASDPSKDNPEFKADLTKELENSDLVEHAPEEEKVLNEELVNAETSDLKDNLNTKPPVNDTNVNDTNEVSGIKDMSTDDIKEEVIKVLRTCYDPEIPVDIWELGLIYDIVVATNRDVLIVMTLTSPSCPVAGTLPQEVEQKVKEHPMVNDCKVQLTFDPPWNQTMMSEVAKLELGFL